MPSRAWIKIHCNKWLEGTIRQEPPDIRGIWVDLLTLAGSGEYGDDGIISLKNDVGLGDFQIKKLLNLSNFLWKKAKNRLVTTGRITVNDDNVITIINWKKYQSEYHRQLPYRQKFTVEQASENVTKSFNKELPTEVQSEITHKVTQREGEGDREGDINKTDKPSLNYENWKENLKTNPNKTGVLGECFKQTHTNAPPEDLNGNLFGRIAALVKISGNDHGRVLQIIWQTAAIGIQGSHLNYIQGILRQHSKKEEVRPTVKYPNPVKAPWE